MRMLLRSNAYPQTNHGFPHPQYQVTHGPFSHGLTYLGGRWNSLKDEAGTILLYYWLEQDNLSKQHFAL